MYPNNQSFFANPNEKENVDLPRKSNMYYKSPDSSLDIQKDFSPQTTNLLGDQQIDYLLFSPKTKGQSPMSLIPPRNYHYPPATQFRDSNYVTFAPYDNQTSRLWRELLGGLKFLARQKAELNSSISHSSQKIDDPSYLVHCNKNDLFVPQNQDNINLFPVQLPPNNVRPCYDVQPLFSDGDGSPPIIQTSSPNFEISPKSDNSFRSVDTSPISAIDQSFGSHKKSPDFNEIANRRRVNSPTVSCEDDSIHLMNKSINQVKNLQSNSYFAMNIQDKSSMHLLGSLDQATHIQHVSIKRELYKTELCVNFLKGSCSYGSKCQFAHGPDEIRALSKHPKHKTKACENYLKNGWCRYVSKCNFIHRSDANELVAFINATAPHYNHYGVPSTHNPGYYIVKNYFPE